MYHWDVLVMYHWDVVGCFIWALFETSCRRTDGTLSLRPHEMSSRHTKKTLWRRTTETSWRSSTETSLGVLFEMYLRHPWDVQRDVNTTSPRRLVVGWAFLNNEWVKSQRWYIRTTKFGSRVVQKHCIMYK